MNDIPLRERLLRRWHLCRCRTGKNRVVDPILPISESSFEAKVSSGRYPPRIHAGANTAVHRGCYWELQIERPAAHWEAELVPWAMSEEGHRYAHLRPILEVDYGARLETLCRAEAA